MIMSTLDLVYLDDQLVVLNKPSGLLSVPGRGEDKQDCLIARAQSEWPDALTVHRLDMATSGLVVIARGPEVQRSLSQAFAKREVHKTYEAVVDGILKSANESQADAWQDIQMPLLIDWPNRPQMQNRLGPRQTQPHPMAYPARGLFTGNDPSRAETYHGANPPTALAHDGDRSCHTGR